MAHPGHHRLLPAALGHTRLGLTATAARQLEIAAATLLIAYGVVCFVLVFSDANAPGGVIELGVCAIVSAAVGFLAPGLTGVVLLLAGAVTGPATALIALAVGGNYATTLEPALLVAFFVVPAVAGTLLLAAARVGRASREL